jgi:MFS family permease
VPGLGSTVAHLGFRTPFFIYAGTLLVAGGIGLVLLPRTWAVDPADEAAAAPSRTLPEMWRLRAYRAATLVNLTDHWAAMGVRNALVPLFVTEVLDLPENWVYLGFLIASVSNAALLYPAGRWADNRGRKPVMLMGLALLIASMTLLATQESLAAYVVAMSFVGIGSGMLSVAPAAMVGDLAGGKSGTAVAAYQMAGDAGAVAGPVVGGALADRVSYGAAFGVTAAVLAASGILAIAAPETRVPRAEPAAD